MSGQHVSAAASAELIARPNRISPLSGVPFHANVDAIVRRAPSDFPWHVAVHEVADHGIAPTPYVQLHSHPAAELNLLIGAPGELVYDLHTDAGCVRVESPATIWVPAGRRHAATLVRGSGVFVCVIVASTERAFATHAAPHTSQADDVRVIAGLPAPGELPVEIVVEHVDTALRTPTQQSNVHAMRNDHGVLWLLLGDDAALHASWQRAGRSWNVASPASACVATSFAANAPVLLGRGTLVTVTLPTQLQTAARGVP